VVIYDIDIQSFDVNKKKIRLLIAIILEERMKRSKIMFL